MCEYRVKGWGIILQNLQCWASLKLNLYGRQAIYTSKLCPQAGNRRKGASRLRLTRPCLTAFANRTPLKSQDLLEIHKKVTSKTLEKPAYEGAFRKIHVYVGNAVTGRVVFMPPKAGEVPVLVEDFLAWLNSPEANKIDPVLEAGISHYELVRIHPFVDGNGRTARVVATIILYKRGFDVKRFFALDDYYDDDRPSYYAVLKAIDQKSLDLTGWLEYFTDGVAVSLKAVKEKVIGLSRDIKFLKERGQVALTERQVKIVERVIDKGSISNREIRDIFNLSNRAALDEIIKLVELGVIKQKGSGRSTRYELA